MTTSAASLVQEFKRSGKFDELRRYLIEEFSQSPAGQQLYTSLTRMAGEVEASSKASLIAALGKSALFNSRNRGVIGGDLLHSKSFKDRVRAQLRDSLEDIKAGRKGAVKGLGPSEESHLELEVSLEEGQISHNNSVSRNSKVDNTGDSMLVDAEKHDEMDTESIDLKMQAATSKNESPKDGEKIDSPKSKGSDMMDLDIDEAEPETKEDLKGNQNDDGETNESAIKFDVGQTVACLVSGRYYLATIEQIREDKNYILKDSVQQIRDPDAKNTDPLNRMISCSLIDIKDEKLYDRINLGDKVFAIYREDGDEELLSSELYHAIVVGLGQNGLFVRYDDGEKQMVKPGEVFPIVEKAI